MTTVADVRPAIVSLRMRPDESIAEFAARVARAHGPLTGEEIAKLRKVFAPAVPQTRTAPVGTGAAA